MGLVLLGCCLLGFILPVCMHYQTACTAAEGPGFAWLFLKLKR